VRAGLGIVETLKQHNIGLQPEGGVSLAVRLGSHSGVVVGEVGRATRQEHLALCEIPNIASRLPGIAGSASVKLYQRGRPNFQHPRRMELASGAKPSTI
jgi:hypothetical protein